MIEVYRNKYIVKRAFVKDKTSKGDFLLVGMTTNDSIVFTRYFNGQIVEQKGFDISWFKEKGVDISTLEIDAFTGHECFTTFQSYLQEFGDFEFVDPMVEVPYVGQLFKVDDAYQSIYLDSSLGAVLRFSSEVVEIEKISNAVDFFFMNFHKIRDQLIQLLFDQYKYFKEEVLDWELDEEEVLEYPDITKTEEVRKLIEFNSIHYYDLDTGIHIQLGGQCSWDPEHGFTFRINEELEIEEVHY
ncbi:MAG: hypothetical protein P1U56_18385 [Saprospiraceae bacterium]|nr:hypothetical protein [Saprospiraceae bacterium]